MMERIWDDILRRFGQPVVLKQNGRTTALQALIQPLSAQSQEQERPGPLGLGQIGRASWRERVLSHV